MSVDPDVTTLLQQELAPIKATLLDHEKRLDALERPAPPEPPEPEPEPPTKLRFYGNGITGRNKGNLEARPGNHGIIAYRFVAKHGGSVRFLRCGWTNRVSPYGRGNGGSYRAGIQSMSGADPSGTFLGGTQTKAIPIQTSPESFQAEWPIAGPTLVAGQTYAFVIQNVDASPDANHGSVNNPFIGESSWRSFDAGGGQPHFFYADAPAAVMRKGKASGEAWIVDKSYAPAFDVEYASGSHEGHSVIHAMEMQFPAYVGNLNGASMACWAFTAPHDMRAVATWWWLQKAAGAAAAPIASVRSGGVIRGSGSFVGAHSWTQIYPFWFKAPFPQPVSIAKGEAVRVEVSAAAGTYYVPVTLCRDSSTGAGKVKMMSYPFDESGDPSSHRSLDGANGTTPANSWDGRAPYQAVLELA